MNAVNRVVTSIFDVLLIPFDAVGPLFSLIMVSGIFGILALICFKHISWQKGIKSAKDRIKGHLIEIRIYQDDLGVVAKSIGKILLRNFQYLGLNFGPILPLIAPFTLVAAQLVVRYAFEPVPVQAAGDPGLLPGQGIMLTVDMKRGHEAEVQGLKINLPEGLETDRPLVRSKIDGRAFQEFYARKSGEFEIELELADGTKETKLIAAGTERPRKMQPERTSSFWASWLWPAEDTLTGTPFARIAFDVPGDEGYPSRSYGWIFAGVIGVLLIFLIASMVFGVAILKPLGIQI